MISNTISTHVAKNSFSLVIICVCVSLASWIITFVLTCPVLSIAFSSILSSDDPNRPIIVTFGSCSLGDGLKLTDLLTKC